MNSVMVFRLVSGPDVEMAVTAQEVDSLMARLTETWRGAGRHAFIFHGPDGSQTALNLAHVVLVKVR